MELAGFLASGVWKRVGGKTPGGAGRQHAASTPLLSFSLHDNRVYFADMPPPQMRQ